jgi:hypothetical protein
MQNEVPHWEPLLLATGHTCELELVVALVVVRKRAWLESATKQAATASIASLNGEANVVIHKLRDHFYPAPVRFILPVDVKVHALWMLNNANLHGLGQQNCICCRRVFCLLDRA